LTGEDRQAPSMEFKSRDPAAEVVDPLVQDRINKICESQGGPSRLCEPRLRNPYMQTTMPPSEGPTKSSKPAIVQPLSKLIQFGAIFALSLLCFLFQLNYSVAMFCSVLGFMSLQYLNIKTFITPSPLLSVIPGKLQYLAKGAFYAYSLWDVLILHLLSVVLVQVAFSIARGVDLVFVDPKSTMDTVAKTLESIKNNLHVSDDPDDVYDPDF